MRDAMQMFHLQGVGASQVIIVTLLVNLLIGFIPAGRVIVPVSAYSNTKHEAQAEFKAWLTSIADRVASNGVDPRAVKPGAFFHSEATVQDNPGFTKFIVDPAGGGHFTKIQHALDAIPSDKSRTNRVVIYMREGTYVEQLIIGKDKPFVTLQGAGLWNTKVSWKENLGQSGSDITDATAQISGDYFTAIDISFENTSPAPPSGAENQQATALAISGDKAAFLRVGFFGFQDTLYDRYGRHYFQNCHISGSIDFIYGDGQSLYIDSQLQVQPVKFGSLTAQKRSSQKEPTGYSFVNCGVVGEGYVYLGRAWGPASTTVFSNTYLADIINPAGWYDWGESSRDKTVFFGEYKNYGPGANRFGRASFGRELTDEEAAPFQTVNFVDGYSWLPDSGISV